MLTADRFGRDPRQAVAELAHKVKNHPLISVRTRATVASVSGYVGNFTTTIAEKGAVR